jgi:hypothetical protein
MAATDSTQQSILGQVGSVGIDIKLNTLDIIKLGVTFLIVLVLFALIFHLIGKLFH